MNIVSDFAYPRVMASFINKLSIMHEIRSLITNFFRVCRSLKKFGGVWRSLEEYEGV